MLRLAVIFLLIASPLPGAERVHARTEPTQLRVYAAASLTDAMRELAPLYERRTGVRLVFNFAGSHILARQIASGAPADLFLSADEARMATVSAHIDRRVSVLSNRLLILGDLRTARRIALADPSSVPAGVYAKAYLVRSGLWPSVQNRVVPVENARAALAAFESGNAAATIVYDTDTTRRGVLITDGPPISYPFATLKASPRLAAARQFLAWLQSEQALSVFRRHGFVIR